jgi:hypothetical protein
MQTSRTKTAIRPQETKKLKAGMRPDEDQAKRFIEAAREAECSEDEAVFDEALKRVAKAKPVKLAKRPKKDRS